MCFFVLIATVGVCQTDSTAAQARYPDRANVEKFRNDHQYRYDRDPAPPQNPVQKLWSWLIRRFFDGLRSNAYQNFWQYVLMAAVVCAAGWLFVKANLLKGAFERQPATKLAYSTLTENIHEIDFTALIQGAIENHNYRLAVRLYYLKALKDLADARVIDWQPNKTNRSYLQEVGNRPSLYEPFSHLTHQFEYIWYGDFPVSEVFFEEVKGNFTDFSGQINT